MNIYFNVTFKTKIDLIYLEFNMFLPFSLFFAGDIYIHVLTSSRSSLEDPPSITEGVGGRVTDYRVNVCTFVLFQIEKKPNLIQWTLCSMFNGSFLVLFYFFLGFWIINERKQTLSFS